MHFNRIAAHSKFLVAVTVITTTVFPYIVYGFIAEPTTVPSPLFANRDLHQFYRFLLMLLVLRYAVPVIALGVGAVFTVRRFRKSPEEDNRSSHFLPLMAGLAVVVIAWSFYKPVGSAIANMMGWDAYYNRYAYDVSLQSAPKIISQYLNYAGAPQWPLDR